MTGCFFTLAAIFFVIGLVNMFTPDKPAYNAQAVRDRRANQRQGFSGPAGLGAAGLGAAAAGAGAVQAVRAMKAAHQAQAYQTENSGGNQPANPPSGGSMAPQALSDIQVGQRITIRHPQQGELTLYVMGRVLYQELWQTSRGPQAPWVPTGNSFAGFWLETDRLLLNWQNRYYLLDERIALGDAEIARDFAPHARKFAQSDQTAEVLFAYPPGMWRMVDIGKFRIERIEGEGLRMQPGAVGRFIHAHGSDGARALVVEDFEGSGQDVAWIGVTLQPEDIK